MRALTLWQPWATLIALGAKRVETRGWRPPATVGRVLICSARRPMNLDQDVACDARRRIAAVLEAAGYQTSGFGSSDALPLGKALCVVTIHSVQFTEVLRRTLSEDELAFGDYRPGRVGWMLGDLRTLPHPFDVHGRQGLFEVHDDLVVEAQRA